MWFRSGAMLFTDRGFRLIDFPAALAEEKFLRSSIDATEFDVVRGGRLIVLTPQLIPGAASQAEALERQGFVRTKEDRLPSATPSNRPPRRNKTRKKRKPVEDQVSTGQGGSLAGKR